MCCAYEQHTLFKGDNIMLETLKKILRKEDKENKEAKEQDVLWDREIERLTSQGTLKETLRGEDDE